MENWTSAYLICNIFYPKCIWRGLVSVIIFFLGCTLYPVAKTPKLWAPAASLPCKNAEGLSPTISCSSKSYLSLTASLASSLPVPFITSYHASQARWTTSYSPTHPVVSNPHRFFTAWKDYFSPPSPLLTHLWGSPQLLLLSWSAAQFPPCFLVVSLLYQKYSFFVLVVLFLSLPRMTQRMTLMLMQNCEDRCCDFFLFWPQQQAECLTCCI